jgi:3-oxo-5-alpha-steroid 4-dehydrogenase 1
MSPIHIVVCLMALSFQLSNATALGGWLAAYGPVTAAAWSRRSTATLGLGAAVWAAGLAGNIWHDDILRELRRKAAREQAEKEAKEGAAAKAQGKSVDKVYLMPEAGLFRWILYPHYLCEWIEWAGFWAFGGPACIPARSFVVNEVATMWPRARQGYFWYIHRFGKEKVGSRTAILPGIA